MHRHGPLLEGVHLPATTDHRECVCWRAWRASHFQKNRWGKTVDVGPEPWRPRRENHLISPTPSRKRRMECGVPHLDRGRNGINKFRRPQRIHEGRLTTGDTPRTSSRKHLEPNEAITPSTTALNATCLEERTPQQSLPQALRRPATRQSSPPRQDH